MITYSIDLLFTRNGICRSGLSNTHLHQDMTNGSVHPDDITSDTNSAEVSDNDSDEEEFVYPGVTDSSTDDTPASIAALEDPVAEPAPVSTPAPVQHHPSPAQLESLYAAASSGDLSLLQKLFRNALQSGDVEAFALANDASTRTGFTALHAAASRGFLDIVRWRTLHFTPVFLSIGHCRLTCFYSG